MRVHIGPGSTPDRYRRRSLPLGRPPCPPTWAGGAGTPGRAATGVGRAGLGSRRVSSAVPGRAAPGRGPGVPGLERRPERTGAAQGSRYAKGSAAAGPADVERRFQPEREPLARPLLVLLPSLLSREVPWRPATAGGPRGTSGPARALALLLFDDPGTGRASPPASRAPLSALCRPAEEQRPAPGRRRTKDPPRRAGPAAPGPLRSTPRRPARPVPPPQTTRDTLGAHGARQEGVRAETVAACGLSDARFRGPYLASRQVETNQGRSLCVFMVLFPKLAGV